MFDRIAGRYDFMNRFLSARTDIGWRKKAISLLKKDNPRTILDVAPVPAIWPSWPANCCRPKG